MMCDIFRFFKIVSGTGSTVVILNTLIGMEKVRTEDEGLQEACYVGKACQWRSNTTGGRSSERSFNPSLLVVFGISSLILPGLENTGIIISDSTE